MRHIFNLLVSLLATCALSAQTTEDVVKWTVTLDRTESVIVFEANIEKDWVTYSQHLEPDGPIPTEFEFETVSGAVLSGEVVEMTTPIKKYSEMFDMEVLKFSQYAKFVQKVELSDGPVDIKGSIFFMACDAHKCLPPTSIPFTLN